MPKPMTANRPAIDEPDEFPPHEAFPDRHEKARRREAVLFWAFILAVFGFAMIGLRVWADINVTP